MNGPESFETRFRRVAHYSGCHSLDPVLLSLLSLKTHCGLEKLSDGRSLLVNLPNLEKKMRRQSPSLVKRYKSLKNHPDFNLVEFCKMNNIQQDKIGNYPLIFNNPRVVWHALSLTNAIALTMKMHQLDRIQFPQRIAGGKWIKSTKNLYTNLFRNILGQLIRKRFNDTKEKELIKIFKTSLCRLVSEVFEQDELPEGEFLQVFPSGYWDILKKKLSTDELARFVFSVLQSKALCEDVPQSFIQDALEKHRKQLSSPCTPLSEDILNLLREKGRKFGRHVARHYRPSEGYQPTGKATYQFPRSLGGVKGDLVYNKLLTNDRKQFDPDDRPEPYVIGLFGQPGSGKSTEINRIISNLQSLFPGVSTDQLVYQRTCSVDHWDGYTGQPIVVLDDLGQSSKGDDIREFQTLVSTCPYVLPMPSLEEKGMIFGSSIILATSNLSYGEILARRYGDNVIIDDNSFWRRFHYPIFTEKGQRYAPREPATFEDGYKLLYHRPSHVKPNPLSSLRTPDSHKLHCSFWRPLDDKDYRQVVQNIKGHWKYHNDNLSLFWRQTVLCGKNSSDDYFDWLHSQDLPESLTDSVVEKDTTPVNVQLTFPSYPPDHILPVRVEPIVEPLKVRTITAGIGQTFCLKPFQVAMWRALDHFPQFALTHGTNRLEKAIERIYEKSSDGDVWISGDYTAATDSIPIEASKALLDGILESIDHLPTKRWALKEMSPHLLVYPKKSGLEPVLQESGQLMGSLLSFPLLCLLNDCTAEMAGLSPDKYLINGDDILMRGHPSTYSKWKSLVSSVGLELSLGKNYIHPRYGTVNSQMIIDDTVVDSGKQKVLDRRDHILGECQRDLELQMSTTPTDQVISLFRSVNRQKLSRTIRGVGIPYSHGGLSFSWSDKFSKSRNPDLYKLVYFHDLLNRIQPRQNCLAVPYFAKKGKSDTPLRLQEEQCLNPVELKESHEDFLRIQDLSQVRNRILGNKSLKNLFRNFDLKSYPSLPFIHCFQIPIKSMEKSSRIQEIVYQKFFSDMIDGSYFKYSDFREHVLKGLVGLSPEEEEIKLSFTLFDFPPDEDFPELDLNYKVLPFDEELFMKKISGSFAPRDLGVNLKQFDHHDFSVEVDGLIAEVSDLYELGPIQLISELKQEDKFPLSEFLSNLKC
nr:MAG: putative RNA-dependent RNA polymerase [Narnaviridae sp.]